MSIYYDFYMFIKNKDKFEYCGPYDKNGEEESVLMVKNNELESLLENQHMIDIHKIDGLEKWKTYEKECDHRFIQGYIRIPDIHIKRYHKEGYVLKSILRKMEILNYEYELEDMLEQKRNNKIISITEYKMLSDEEKEKYIYHCWTFENNENALQTRLLEVAKARYYTHITYDNPSVEFEDCVFIVVKTG